MTATTEAKPKPTPADQLPKTYTAYTLKQIDSYSWSIVELRIENGQVKSWKRDVESTKEIKCEKLVDLLATGVTLA